MTSTGALLV